MNGISDKWVGAMNTMGFDPHEEGAPNLDATMESKGLSEFWGAINQSPVICARMMFPSKPKGYVSATYTLGCYAVAKSCAISLRRDGEISRAMVYESHCDIYYKSLPEFARW